MLFRRSADGRATSKLRSSHSSTENPLLARHKRDTSSSYEKRHSVTMTPSDADRLYSCAAAGSSASWSQSLCHAAGTCAFSLPASSDLVFPDCAAVSTPWLTTTDASKAYERRGSVSVIPSDSSLPSSLVIRPTIEATLLSSATVTCPAAAQVRHHFRVALLGSVSVLSLYAAFCMFLHPYTVYTVVFIVPVLSILYYVICTYMYV